MLYIHQTSCISPPAPSQPPAWTGNLLKAAEPPYEGVPGNTLRRMSKSVRMGLGAALPLLAAAPDGILIGTGNGGMEDSVKFLRQIIEYDEGLLTPGAFVQSTANAIASHIGLFSRNRGYNTTYTHRGLAFESALMDAAMLAGENPGMRYLVGGVDEISSHHHRFEEAEGWYKQENSSGKDLYAGGSPGSIAGEGAALFLVSGAASNALACIRGIATLNSEEPEELAATLRRFLGRHLGQGEQPDALISGENGDSRALKWYQAGESVISASTIIRFKHLCGEYPTASAFALWLACNLPEVLPQHLVKRGATEWRAAAKRGAGSTILIYNNYKFSQHSLILLESFP